MRNSKERVACFLPFHDEPANTCFYYPQLVEFLHFYPKSYCCVRLHEYHGFD